MKKLSAIILAAILLLTLVPATALAADAVTGSGTAADPYICNASNIDEIADLSAAAADKVYVRVTVNCYSRFNYGDGNYLTPDQAVEIKNIIFISPEGDTATKSLGMIFDAKMTFTNCEFRDAVVVNASYYWTALEFNNCLFTGKCSDYKVSQNQNGRMSIAINNCGFETDRGIKMNGGEDETVANQLPLDLVIRNTSFKVTVNAVRAYGVISEKMQITDCTFISGTVISANGSTVAEPMVFTGNTVSGNIVNVITPPSMANAIVDPYEIAYTEDATDGETEVKARSEVAYIVIIPAVIDFGVINRSMSTQKKDFTIELRDALLELGTKVVVKVNVGDTAITGQPFNMKNAADETVVLPYKLYYADKLTLASDGDEYVSFLQAELVGYASSYTGEISCEPADLLAAGAYSDTMTFAIGIE